MKAAAVSRLVSVAGVGQASSVSIVANGKNFAKIGRCDDGSHLEASASRSLGQNLGQLKINLRKARSARLLGAHSLQALLDLDELVNKPVMINLILELAKVRAC